MQALRSLYKGKKIIVGREKLDVAKGVYNKVRLFRGLNLDYMLTQIWVTAASVREVPSSLPGMERKGRSHSGHLSCSV